MYPVRVDQDLLNDRMLINAILNIIPFIQRRSVYLYSYLKYLLPVFSLSVWLLSHIIINEIMVNGDIGMNPVGMTFINLSKVIGRVGNRTSNFPFPSPVRYRLRFGDRQQNFKIQC